MTSRERVIAAINRTPQDRVPRYDAFWERTVENFVRQGMRIPARRTLTVDGGLVKPVSSPASDFFDFDMDFMYINTSMNFDIGVVGDDGGKYKIRDRYGWTAWRHKDGSGDMQFVSHMIGGREDWDRYKSRMVFNPKEPARLDSESYFLHYSPYPSWKGAKQIYDALRSQGRYLAFACYGPYEGYWRLRGYTDALTDIILEPELTGDIMDAEIDLTIDTLQYAIDNGMKPDGVFVAEDMGTARAPLFSPKAYLDVIYPRHKRLGDFLRRNGIHFIMHSCGYVEPFIPHLIDAGLDVLQALQVSAGMDVLRLKRLYGDKLTFFGNIAASAFQAGKEAVEKEIRDKIPTAMRGGGYIYHSDHSIPDDVSYETYLFAMKTLEEAGRY